MIKDRNYRAFYSNHKGMALLVTLGLISVLMVASLELVRSTGDSAEMEKKMADRFQAQEMAKSGIELAMFILTRDAEQNDIDSVQEMWADPYVLASAVELLGFDREQGSLDVVITDELGKIQINALLSAFPGSLVNNDQLELWERFLNLLISSDKSADLREPDEIINSLKDWLDSGDDDTISGLSGAESDYYEALDPPVVCSNAPLNRVEELFMIKGVPSNLVSTIPLELREETGSTFNSPLQSNLKNGSVGYPQSNLNNAVSSPKVDLNGLSEFAPSFDPSDIFTVYGMDSSKKEGSKFIYPGTININTADIPLLATMLPAGMEDQASELFSFRIEREQNGKMFSNLLDSGWYKKVISLSSKDAQAFERLVRYSSDLFRIEANAKFNGSAVSLTAFIKREKRGQSGKWGCTLLQLTGN